MSSRRLIAVVALVLGLVTAAQAQPLVFRDDLPGTFIDISTTGTPLNLGDDEEAEIITTVGNLVFPAGRVVVGNNGGMGFNPVSPELDPINQPIPAPGAFGGDMAGLPFWRDIHDKVGNVFWRELDGADTLIVQWHDRNLAGSADTVRFQVQIFSDPGSPVPVYAQFIYDDVEQPAAGGGVIATIGFQAGGAPFNNVQWSFNTAGAVRNGLVLSLVPEPAAGLAMLVMTAAATRRRRPRPSPHGAETRVS